MRTICSLVIALVILCGSASSAFAWGRRGHEIIAEIAFRYLDLADQTKVTTLLHGMSMDEAANWLDIVRGEDKYTYTAPWHYVDFPKGTTYQPTQNPNIINALNKAINDLQHPKNLSDEQTKFDLLVLIHLIGDIHQPLHCGYPDDKGGNDYQVSFLGKGSNLHRVWDSEIIQERNITPEICIAFAEQVAKSKDTARTDVFAWTNETRSLTSLCYPSSHKIDDFYIQQRLPIIEQQLVLSGLRLASLLHKIVMPLELSEEAYVPDVKTYAISLEQVGEYLGKTVEVCGKVYGVKTMAGSGKYTFVNVGAAYPNSPLTLFITSDVRDSFSYKPEDKLDGKDICVTGKLELYKGKPEIVIKKESEIIVTKLN